MELTESFSKYYYRYPSICTILDLYEFALYDLFLLSKTFDLYECHSNCTIFSLFLGRFFWQFGKILTFEGKMLKKLKWLKSTSKSIQTYTGDWLNSDLD